MKSLIIVRHAKSSWKEDVNDRDRALLPRGIVRANQVAQILKNRLDIEPEYWASSPANRAIHTAIIFARVFERLEHLKITESLYTFSDEYLLDTIKKIPNVIDSAIIFGHNDACIDLINSISDSNIDAFKTAHVAVISFNQNRWEDIANGKLKEIITQDSK